MVGQIGEREHRNTEEEKEAESQPRAREYSPPRADLQPLDCFEDAANEAAVRTLGEAQWRLTEVQKVRELERVMEVHNPTPYNEALILPEGIRLVNELRPDTIRLEDLAGVRAASVAEYCTSTGCQVRDVPQETWEMNMQAAGKILWSLAPTVNEHQFVWVPGHKLGKGKLSLPQWRRERGDVVDADAYYRAALDILMDRTSPDGRPGDWWLPTKDARAWNRARHHRARGV